MAGTKGRSGRKRKSTAAKKAAGTTRNDRKRKSPELPAGLPPVPADLHGRAKIEWERLAPLVAKAGLLDQGDWLAWSMGFGSLSRYFQACDALVSLGGDMVMQVGDKGYRQQVPELAIIKQSWTEVMAFCREFGLTPSSRSSLDLADRIGDPPATTTGSTIDPIAGLVN